MKLDVEKFIGEIQEYIQRATKPIAEKMDELAQENKELKALLENKPDYDSIVADVLKQIPTPENGKDGKDTDAESIKALVSEAISEVEIPAPKDGADGQNGADGKDGENGKDADPELIKELVKKAVSEIHIPEPNHGEDGKDALQLEILPEIDESKSYPRNTYAKHNGGLFRSFEKTHGVRGWECIVDGVTDVELEQQDERTFLLSSKFASGKTNQKAFSVPVLIYRNVFKPGDYKKGDTVTWGGSLWHCDEDTSDKPGEVGSKGWTLAAKRGRDGKDGKNGIDKTAPAKTGDKK